MKESLEHLEKYKILLPEWLVGGEQFGMETIGCYAITLPGSFQKFDIIATIDLGEWEHVSVTIMSADRMPKWTEMAQIKDLFWNDDEYVIQFHPAKKDYVNLNAKCLHLWRNRLHPQRIPCGPDNNDFDRQIIITNEVSTNE